MFGTMYDTSSDKFQNYYKDVSERSKKRETVLNKLTLFFERFFIISNKEIWEMPGVLDICSFNKVGNFNGKDLGAPNCILAYWLYRGGG